MAIYDVDADPILAVSTFLSQFSISSTGDVRYVSGTDTFHVTWLHRSLQHKVWDFSAAGDDNAQLDNPNPSRTAALGQIITLEDQTTSGYIHRFNIDQTVTQYLFGGSITQKNATGNNEAWYPLQLSGAAGVTVEPQVVQNGVQLTSFWGTGINQTSPQTIARILVKAVDDGVLIDGGRVVVKAHDFSFEYSNWETTLGLTEQTAVVAAGSDAFNQTLLSTVSAYAISKSEGYNLLDLDGNGDKPYLGTWSYSPETSKQALNEFVKYLLSRDSGQTLYGVDANLWTGRVYEVSVSGGDGTPFVQNEPITWPTGSGNLMGMDDLSNTTESRLWLHLQTGTAPVDGETISGSGTTIVGVGGSVQIDTHPHHLGQFTGSWIAADGIGFEPSQVTNTDGFEDLDGNQVSPPNFVTVNGTITAFDAADDPHVFLARRTGSSINYAQHTTSGVQSTGASVVVINGAIPSTTALTGWIGLLESAGDNINWYEYSSWDGSTFTLTSTLGEDYADGDQLTVALFYQSATGGGTVKTLSRTLVYDGTPIDVGGWIRQGDESAPDAFIPISGQIGAGGFQFAETLSREV